MEKLTLAQIEEQLHQLDDWQLTDGKWIQKKYRFKDYLKGVNFVSKVAQQAEEMDHHPLITIDYKLVTLKLTTWNSGGLTELDVQSARAYDKIYQE